MIVPLVLANALPVLIAEAGKAYRRHLKEKRKAAERQQVAELKALRERIEKLEAAARWAP
jgi:hypothetical protein